VLLECPPSLLRLGNMGADEVVPEGQALPAFDVQAPLLSLPRLLGTQTLADIPADIPYLRCDPELTAQWRQRLESLDDTALSQPKLRIGIAWQGNPVHRSDRYRSVPLARLAPLARLPGVRLFSLQCGFGREQLAGHPDVVDLGAELSDFADTAAVVQCLDVIITVDTAVAHLCGALGVGAWVALPYALDWRWLLERSDSPWYPSLRLFRQPRPGDWDGVFESIFSAISDLLSRNKNERG
jgi:hypothetical protein